MLRQILDHRGNLLSELYFEEGVNNLLIHHKVSQDIEPTLKLAKVLRENQQHSFADKASGMKHVAEIPRVIWDQLEMAGITKDKKKFKEWLNDFSNKPFRVYEGRV